jgi:hypothetical protein
VPGARPRRIAKIAERKGLHRAQSERSGEDRRSAGCARLSRETPLPHWIARSPQHLYPTISTLSLGCSLSLCRIKSAAVLTATTIGK